MTIEFKEKYNTNFNNTYIGYFSPNGSLIEFNNGHKDYHNPIAQDFLTYISFFKNNQLVRGYYNKYDNYEKMIEKLNHHIDTLERVDELKEFEYQLLLFFRNIYKKDDIFEAMGQKIAVELNSSCIKKSLLHHLKDICVQYLGYDSIESYDTTYTKVETATANIKPRVITSTHPNINERYYNYLLMDWEVERFPKYKYNVDTSIYELDRSNIIYENESEEALAEEIKSIKRLIPIQERPKYFR